MTAAPVRSGDQPAPGHPAVTLGLAVALAALAGFVDATGYILYRGLFVSFMSGNTTQAAVALARTALGGSELPRFVEFVRIVALFVAGTVAAELVAAAAGRWWHVAVLALECVLLAAALLTLVLQPDGPDGVAVAALLGVSMGVQNGVLHKAGGLSVGLTYVTGTLVSVGRGIAAALRGAAGWREPAQFACVWASLAAGGFAGALVASSALAAALAVALAGAVAIFAAVLALELHYRRGGGLDGR